MNREKQDVGVVERIAQTLKRSGDMGDAFEVLTSSALATDEHKYRRKNAEKVLASLPDGDFTKQVVDMLGGPKKARDVAIAWMNSNECSLLGQPDDVFSAFLAAVHLGYLMAEGDGGR